MAHDSDEHLVKIYRETRNRKIVGTLFTRYNKMVFLVCMKYLEDEEAAKDAAMQVFESLFVTLQQHEVETFKPWLYSVTRNHCLGLLRKKKPATVPLTDNLVQDADPMEFREETHQKEKTLIQLEEAIGQLKPDQRTCIVLFYLEKKSYEEIITTTGFSFKQVKSHIQNGRRNLRILMEAKS